jgi:hypothetical protein
LTLAELAADARIQSAMKRGGPYAFRLRYVTTYEKPALIPRLDAAYEAALYEPVRRASPAGALLPGTAPVAPKVAGNHAMVAPDRGLVPGSRPADPPPAVDAPPAAVTGRVDLIAEWLDRPEQYDADRDQAAAFAAHIRLTLHLLLERMRIDSAYRKDHELKVALRTKKVALANLLESALARADGELTPEEKADRDAEIARLQELARIEFERRSDERKLIIKDARKAVGVEDFDDLGELPRDLIEDQKQREAVPAGEPRADPPENETSA